MAKNKAYLYKAEKSLSKIEEKILRIKKVKEKPPALVVSFLTYEAGCVPHVLDRPLFEWVIFENHTGTVEVDPLLEYALRNQQLMKKRQAKSTPLKLVKPVEEASANARIPFEIYAAWLAEQCQKLYNLARIETSIGGCYEH